MTSRYKAIDLFAGAGGLSLGLEKAGFEIVLANELEKDFCSTYRANHKDTRLIEGDVQQVDFTRELKKIGLTGKIQLVAGGPPCQGFSTVGKKDEIDPRNSLFEEFLRAVSEINPEFILFENVSGFKKMYRGRIFQKLQSQLEQLGYLCKADVLNAAHFGLPQNRQRTIVIGYKKEYFFDFPEGKFSKAPNSLPTKPLRTLKDAISDLNSLRDGESDNKYARPPQNDYQKSLRNRTPIVTEHVAPNHGASLLNVIRRVPPGGSIMDVPVPLRPKSYFKNTYARLVWDKPAPTMTRNFGTPSSSRCIHPESNRGLTTREGARLQGFPDEYIFCGSRSKKNLQIGNAVPPVLGYELGQSILQSLLKRSGKKYIPDAIRC